MSTINDMTYLIGQKEGIKNGTNLAASKITKVTSNWGLARVFGFFAMQNNTPFPIKGYT